VYVWFASISSPLVGLNELSAAIKLSNSGKVRNKSRRIILCVKIMSYTRKEYDNLKPCGCLVGLKAAIGHGR
jgi:hypothetical protein